MNKWEVQKRLETEEQELLCQARELFSRRRKELNFIDDIIRECKKYGLITDRTDTKSTSTKLGDYSSSRDNRLDTLAGITYYSGSLKNGFIQQYRRVNK